MCSGTSPDKRLVEFIELADHPFWVATQAHPEFKSRPDRAHPLFRELIEAALARRDATPPGLRRMLDEATATARPTASTIPHDRACMACAGMTGFAHLGDTDVHQGYVWKVVVADFEAPDG